jgi:hypothetical protein
VVGVDRVWVHDLVVLLGSSGAVSGRSRRCRRSHSSSWSWLFDPARAAGPVCGRLPYHMESERQGAVATPARAPWPSQAIWARLGRDVEQVVEGWLVPLLAEQATQPVRAQRSKRLRNAGPVARRHGAPQLDHSWEVDVIGVQQAAEEERPWRVGDLPLQRTVAAALHRPSPVELAVRANMFGPKVPPGRGAVVRAGSVPRRLWSGRPARRRPRWPDQPGTERRPIRTPARGSAVGGSGTPGPTPVRGGYPAPRDRQGR